MDEYIKSILKDFFEEAFEILDRLEENILILEKEHDNKDAVQEIFRAIHTLKGSAGSVELNDVAKYAHIFEDLLDLIRNEKIEIDDTTIDVLLKSIDIVKELITCASEEKEYDGNLKKEIKTLEDYKNKKISDGSLDKSYSDKKSKSKETVSSGKSKYDDIILDNALMDVARDFVDAGTPMYIVYVKFNADSPMRTVGGVQVFVGLKEVGDIISTKPSVSDLEGDDFYENVLYLLGSSSTAEEIKKNITLPEITENITIEVFNFEEYEKYQKDKSDKDAQFDMEKSIEDKKEEKHKYKENDNAKQQNLGNVNKERQSSFLRVESERIDAMMNQIGELVINKSSYIQYEDDFQSFGKVIDENINELRRYYKDSLVQILRRFENIISKREIKEIRNTYLDGLNKRIKEVSSSEERFRESLDRYRGSYQILTRVTNELQETVMKIRMVPIAQTFNRFPRLIRDLSRDLGKELELKITGEDTELDKSVIEVLVDPLVHLVRNAIDHGIETPDKRVAKGKKKVGTIHLSASHEGNLIIIKISDDGKGMSAQKIFESAVKKGLVSPDAKLSEKEMLDFIMEPGFSTADKITNVSGRGVGMDVVKKRLEKINGTISIETVLNEGSTFSLRIPLTLAIIQALIVDTEKEFYAVPINSIVETLKIDADKILEFEGVEVIKVRDEVITILSIKELFKLPKRYENVKSYYAVILTSEDKKIALLVNNLIGEQDIVIKALKGNLAKTEGIAGATILGDGTVSFILDIQTIVYLGAKRIIERSEPSSKDVNKTDLKSFLKSIKETNSVKSIIQEEDKEESDS